MNLNSIHVNKNRRAQIPPKRRDSTRVDWTAGSIVEQLGSFWNGVEGSMLLTGLKPEKTETHERVVRVSDLSGTSEVLAIFYQLLRYQLFY